jgi:hypothetical protein
MRRYLNAWSREIYCCSLCAHYCSPTTSVSYPAHATHASSHRNNLEVETTSETFIGHKVSNESRVTESLGVRYAEPLTDALTFAAPEAYVVPENTIFEASHWLGLTCYPQNNILPTEVCRFSIEQAIWLASVQEFCCAKQQLRIGGLLEAQHLDYGLGQIWMYP